jgi:hypothetical protein
MPEPQQRSAQEGTPRAITTSTSTTTTLVSTQLTSAHVGFYVIPEDGSARGMVRQTKQHVTVTNTQTVDAAWPSTANVSSWRMWQPPDIPVAADSGTTTTIVDAAHASVTNEPDDYFNGWYLVGKTGSNAGAAVQITDFTSSTGTFTFASGAWAATPAPGDCFLIRMPFRPEGPVTATVNKKTLSRRIVGYAAADQAVPLTAEGNVEFELAERHLTASAPNATAATPPYEIGPFLRDLFTQTLDTGSTYSSQGGSAPTGVTIDVASGSGFTVGGFVLMSTGEVSQITSKSSNTLTLPQLTTAANVASSNVYASAWYTRKSLLAGDYRTRGFDIYKGGLIRNLFHGCMPTVHLTGSRDQLWKWVFKYMAGDAFEYNIAHPNSLSGYRMTIPDTTVPTDGKAAILKIDSIPILVASFDIDMGFVPQMRPSISGPNQTEGCTVDLVPVKGTITGYLADNDDISSHPDLSDRLSLGSTVSLMCSKGTAPKETSAWAVPAASITKITPSVANAAHEFSIEFEGVLPQATRGSSAHASLPDFAFGKM